MLVMGGKWGEINGKFQGRFEKWDQLKVGVSGVEKRKRERKRKGAIVQGGEALKVEVSCARVDNGEPPWSLGEDLRWTRRRGGTWGDFQEEGEERWV